jgi:hypothetical protein
MHTCEQGKNHFDPTERGGKKVMKLAVHTKFRFVYAIAFALCGAAANATPISGFINFDGIATTNTGNLSTATAFTSISDTSVYPVETGNYAVVPLFYPDTFKPFSFSAAGVTPLWTFTVGAVTYSFDATSIEVVYQSGNFLDLSGTGVAYITGFTPTVGAWSITDTSTNSGARVFTFGADSAPLPDAGGTALLIGLGLAGAAAGMIVRRSRLAKA